MRSGHIRASSQTAFVSYLIPSSDHSIGPKSIRSWELRLSTRTRQVYLVIIPQAACIAVGMWTHYRFAANALRQEVQADAWARLDVAARSAAEKLVVVPTQDSTGNAAQSLQIASALRASSVSMILTTPDWHVI